MVDTDFSQQNLEELILAVSATAVIVMRINDPSIKITAGALSQSGFHDLGESLVRYWPESLGQNVNRYAGLSFDGYFQKFFVKRLSDGQHWLGLLFPLRTSFQRMRQDMTAFSESLLGKNLLGSDFDQCLEYFLQHTDHLTPGLRQEYPSGQGQAGWIRINDFFEDVEDTQLPEKMFHTQENIAEEAYQVSQTLNSTNIIVEDVTELHSHDDAWLDIDVAKDEVSWQINDDRRSLAGRSRQKEKIGSKEQESLPEGENSPQEEQIEARQVLQETSQHKEDLVSIFQEDLELRGAAAGLNDWFITPEAAGEQAVLEQVSGFDHKTTWPRIDEWASDKEVVSDITFCLVPRLDEHFLFGKLAENLRSWLPAICDQYSWQLDSLSVRPKYLKWTLRDFPESLIGEMFKIVRQKTSESFFRIFPELQNGNSSGDFWSPGYSVDTQDSKFITEALVNDVEKIPFCEQMIGQSRILPSLTSTRIPTDIRQSRSSRSSEKDRRIGSSFASNKEGGSQNK